jgi:superfamily II DNA or RNA helicase
MFDVQISKESEVYLKVDAPLDILDSITNHFKYYADGFRYAKSYKYNFKKFRTPAWGLGWDGRISLFKAGMLPCGLLSNLIEYCKTNNLTFKLPEPERIDIPDIGSFLDEIFKESKFKPRDYQVEAIHKLLLNKRGVIEYGTGSGKSLIIYSLIRYLIKIGRKVVLIVPNVQLVEQARHDYSEYGWVGLDEYVTVMYEDHIPDETKPVLISTFQSLALKDYSWVSRRYTSVIIDECHGGKTVSIKTILEQLLYADYRFGVTGTLPDSTKVEKIAFREVRVETIDLPTIFGYIGPLLAEKKSKALMEEKVLSKLKVVNLIIKYPQDIIDKNKNRPYEMEKLFYIEYEPRYKIFNYTISHLPKTNNILILCYEIKHLHKIYEYLQSKFPDRKIFEIWGKTKIEERIDMISDTENSGGVIIVASYGTLSTGVNIKKLHTIIFASSYKAKIKVLQSLGRGLRLHESKKSLILFDMVDDLRYETSKGVTKKNHVWLHFEQRLDHYKNQGFDYVNKIVELDKI